MAFSTHAALVITRHRDDGVLGADGVCRTRDRPRRADRVLPQGAAIRTGLGRHPHRGRRLPVEAAAVGDNIPLALLGWVAGCTAIWSALFAVGNFLYGRLGYALVLTAIFAVSGLVLVRIVTRLWVGAGEEALTSTR